LYFAFFVFCIFVSIFIFYGFVFSSSYFVFSILHLKIAEKEIAK